MRRKDLWKLSLLNLFASPVRSALTVLGFAIGVAAILAVLTLGEAGKNQVQSELDRLGIDKLWVTPGQAALRHGDADLLWENLSMTAAEAAYWPAQIRFGERSISLSAIGCTQNYLQMTGVQLLEGRMLYPLEWKADSRCLLLGQNAAEKLGVCTGSVVHLSGIPFRVCGIVGQSDVFSKMEIDASAYVPLAVLTALTGNTVHEILVDVPDASTPAKSAEAVNRFFNTEGRTVETLTMQTQMNAAQSVVDTFVSVLKWVAFVCILVGGVGVMNILLVSVRERRREIGIMKSLGAMHGQICALFLTEAVLYAVIGGLLGILLGSLLVVLAGRSIGLSPVLRLKDATAVFLSAAAVGLVFGVTPAFRAASLRCVDALREE